MIEDGAFRLEIEGDGPLAQALRAQAAPTGRSPELQQRVLVIDHGEDVETLAALRRRRGEDARIFAQVGDAALRRAAQSRLEAEATGELPTLLGAGALEAECFARRFRPDRIAWMRGQERVHIVLVGFGAYGVALFDALAASGVAAGLQRQRFLIVAPDASEARARLADMAPEIGLSLDVEFAACAPRDLADPVRSPIAAAEVSAPLTAIFVAEERRETTLADCLAICELQDRHGRGRAALFLGGAGREIACDVVAPLRPARDLGQAIAPIPGLGEIPLCEYLLKTRDVAARRLHEAYLKDNQGARATGWDRLSETYRRANRRAAAHVALKLAALGFEACDDGHVDPGAYAAVLQPLIDARYEDAAIRTLARIEHERWALDRRLDGWVYAPIRDDAGRKHPSLVEFDDPRLPAAEIAKDVAQTRFVIGALVQPFEGGARCRIAIAAVSSDEASPSGLALAQALDLLDQQPWREPAILSPLATPEEIDAVDTLVAALAQRSRQYLLVVQERADLAKPALDDARAARRRRLLADPHAYVAPQETPASATDWVEEAAGGVESFASLVRSRCDVWLKLA